MLDSTIEALHRELASRFQSDTRLGKYEIEAGELPRAISSYLVVHLEREAQQELERLELSKLRWIDVQEENVRQRLDALAHEALEHAIVPEDERDHCLRKAADFAVGAAIDPRAALVELVFGDDETSISSDRLTSRLGRFDAHLPLRDAVNDSIEKRPDETYTRERFRSIVSKVDDLRTDGFAPSDWLDELSVLCALLDDLGLPGALPAEQVAAFLAAKRCTTEAKVVATAGTERITAQDAKDMIQAAVSTRDAGNAPSHAPKEEPRELSLFSQALEAGAAPTPQDRDPASVPLWKRFQKDFNAPMGSRPQEARPATRSPSPAPPTETKALSPDRVARPKPADKDSAEHGERSQRPLWQQYRSGKPDSKSDGLQVADLKELELGVLGPDAARGRDSFIDDLFGGDEEAYLDAMDELSHANTWGEASKVIADRVFKRYKVNIYSEPAVAFTNAVEARYRARRVNA